MLEGHQFVSLYVELGMSKDKRLRLSSSAILVLKYLLTVTDFVYMVPVINVHTEDSTVRISETTNRAPERGILR